VEWLGGHRLRLEFNNGDAGEVDLSKCLQFQGELAPLADPAFVAKARVHFDAGTVCWPGDIDLDPEVLHHRATGKPLPKGG
jgi:hypothetical protein